MPGKSEEVREIVQWKEALCELQGGLLRAALAVLAALAATAAGAAALGAAARRDVH